MKANKRKFLVLGAILPIMLAMGAPVAADPRGAPVPVPSMTPEREDGKVDGLDLGNNLIVIDDREYYLPADVSIRAGSGAGNRSQLRSGMRVSFTHQSIAGRRTVTGIWLGR